MWCTEKAALTIEGPWWQTVMGNMYDFPLEEMRLVKLPGPAGPHPPKTLLDMVMVSITGYSLVPEEAWTVLKVLWARRSAVARAQSDDGRIARAKGRLRAGCGV